MRNSLRDRFREVDRVPTPWDTSAVRIETIPSPSSWNHARAVVLAAASLAVAGLVAIVAIVGTNGGGPTSAADASWLLTTQASCVEQYSAQTLPNRDYAFEGVIASVDRPGEPAGTDLGGATTTVIFDVKRWFWGGTGDRVSLRTYAAPPVSREAVDASIGAHLLASGDEDFLWACGFTKPFSESAADEFEAAAAEVES
jgi:hypothetical protein